jgi:hypothetical protein
MIKILSSFFFWHDPVFISAPQAHAKREVERGKDGSTGRFPAAKLAV